MIIVFITNKSINRIIIWSGLSFTGGALETALFRCRGYAGVMPGLCRGYTGVIPGLCRGYAGVIPGFKEPNGKEISRFLERRLPACNSLSYLKFVKRFILEGFSPGVS